MTVGGGLASIVGAIALVQALDAGRGTASGDTAALSLHATVASMTTARLPADSSAVASAKAEASAKAGLPAEASAKAGMLTISLSRWSTDAERAPLVAAFAAPPPPPPPPAAPAAAAGRGRGRGAPPPPPSPFARLSTAIKAAPTLGFIWTEGVTGYSIKYAWHSPTAPATEAKERIVLVTDRRLDSHAANWAPASGAAADAEFTVIEMRIDRQGAGEGKTSLTTKIAIDAETKTLALEDYAAAPASLKVTR